MKLYIVENGKIMGDTRYVLVAETGEPLAGHICSSKSFAKGDLYENRPERKQEFKKRFGEVEVIFLGDDQMTKEELIKRNQEWNKLRDISEKQVNNDR